MAYTVHFVGLVYFYDEPEGLRVLAPNGTNPGVDIPNHYASFFTQERDIASSTWWDGYSSTHDVEIEDVHGNPVTIKLAEWRIPENAEIHLPKPDNTALENVNLHDALPKLKDMDKYVNIIPERADTIAQIPIRRGEIEVHSFADGSVVQLRAQYSSDVKIVVTPFSHPEDERELVLKAQAGPLGTEILFCNAYDLLAGDANVHAGQHMSLTGRSRSVSFKRQHGGKRSGVAASPAHTHTLRDHRSHLEIYGRLDVKRRGRNFRDPGPPSGLTRLQFTHLYLEAVDQQTQTPGLSCPPTCC